jgi:hypothetical protein
MERSNVTRSTLAAACAIVLGFVLQQPAQAQPVTADVGPQSDRFEAWSNRPVVQFHLSNEDGFGDCVNTYSWSMAWFRGKLYVGTNRGSTLGVIGDPDFHCTGEGGAAEIWRYTPKTRTWELAFRSPSDVQVPLTPPGTFAARDNGFRDMIVFREADGTEALYVAGVIYPTLFEPRRPRILRSTDGVTFEAVPTDAGTVLGDVNATGFRAMAVYKGRLYVTAGSVIGEGVILAAENPAGGNDNFQQVSPPGMLAFELAVFNGFLYIGSAESAPFTGYNVFKTDAEPTGTPFHNFIPVVTHGAFGPYFLGPNNAILSMTVFKNRLYVGGQTDLIRVNPDDTWDLVVGDPRTTPLGPKAPLSGLPAGFGNPFTGHLWRMEDHQDRLYVGTWDVAVFLRNIPIIGPIAAAEAGFDLWTTEDGVFWRQITRNGLGNIFNHGVRSLLSTREGLFLGTVNPWDGTQVWLGRTKNRHRDHDYASFDPIGIRAADGAATGGEETSPSLTSPDRLESERQGGTNVLSWEPSPQAAQFRVFRAVSRPNRELGIQQLPKDAWIPEAFTSIGTTARPYFRDSAVEEGVRYAYYVRAEKGRGQVSESSNMVMSPSLAPAVTFDRVHAAIRGLTARHEGQGAGIAVSFLRSLGTARAAAERGDLPLAQHGLETLRKRVLRNPGELLDPLAAEELDLMVANLLRRVRLAQSGVIPIADVVDTGRP